MSKWRQFYSLLISNEGRSPNWSAAPWKFSSLEFSGSSIGITPWTSVWPELGRSGFYPGSNLSIQILELLIHCEFLDPLFLLKSEKEPISMTKPDLAVETIVLSIYWWNHNFSFWEICKGAQCESAFQKMNCTNLVIEISGLVERIPSFAVSPMLVVSTRLKVNLHLRYTCTFFPKDQSGC